MIVKSCSTNSNKEKTHGMSTENLVHLHIIHQSKNLLIRLKSFLMTFIYLRHESSSLYTPFEVMFGRKAVLPVDCEEGLPFPPLHSGVGMEAAVSMLTNK